MMSVNPFSCTTPVMLLNSVLTNALSENTESTDRLQYSDTPLPVPFIKTSFTLPTLLHDVVINLSRCNTLPQKFSEQMYFACLSIFATHRGFMPLLLKCINSITLKVGYIICSSPSRAWKMKDISNALYMSESLLKRKLREENFFFSDSAGYTYA